jgi:hypothetical protein
MRAREWIACLVAAVLPLTGAAQPERAVVEAPPAEIVYDPPPALFPEGLWWTNISMEFGWTTPRSWPNVVNLRPPDLVGNRIPSLTLPRNDARYGLQMGLGLNIGRWFSEEQHFGLDFGGLLFPGPTRGINGYTTGTLVHFPNGPDQSAPILVRFPEPFANFAMPLPATATDLFATLDLNLRAGGRINDSFRLDVLVGYRFAFLQDQLYLGTENTNSGTTNGDYQQQQTSNDAYKANRMTVENAFHGGQVGLEGTFNTRRFFASGAAKIAYGGLTTSSDASGAFLYPSMRVRFQSETRGVFLPTFTGRFGVRLSEGCSVYVGYNFLQMPRISRFGDAFAPGCGPLPSSDFWVQSVSLGFDLRF